MNDFIVTLLSRHRSCSRPTTTSEYSAKVLTATLKDKTVSVYRPTLSEKSNIGIGRITCSKVVWTILLASYRKICK